MDLPRVYRPLSLPGMPIRLPTRYSLRRNTAHARGRREPSSCSSRVQLKGPTVLQPSSLNQDSPPNAWT
eukprot:3561449-Pleurochrysis_carterae.AAC.1